MALSKSRHPYVADGPGLGGFIGASSWFVILGGEIGIRGWGWDPNSYDKQSYVITKIDGPPGEQVLGADQNLIENGEFNYNVVVPSDTTPGPHHLSVTLIPKGGADDPLTINIEVCTYIPPRFRGTYPQSSCGPSLAVIQNEIAITKPSLNFQVSFRLDGDWFPPMPVGFTQIYGVYVDSVSGPKLGSFELKGVLEFNAFSEEYSIPTSILSGEHNLVVFPDGSQAATASIQVLVLALT
jgi:hypothetical protein